MPIVRLSDSTIPKTCVAPKEGELTAGGNPRTSVIYWWAELPNLGILVRRPKAKQNVPRRVWVFQRSVAGRDRRMTIGQWPAWTCKRARERAHELTVQFDEGRDPVAQERARRGQATTLREARKAYLAHLRRQERSERWILDIEKLTERHAGDLLDREVVSLERRDICALHERVSKKGPVTANRVVSAIGTIIRWAIKEHGLVGHDAVAGFQFNPERPKQERIGDLAAWRKAVETLTPTQCALQLVGLTTGLRAGSLTTIRVEDVDFERRTLMVPRPKGGEARRFFLPLARFTMGVLRLQLATNRGLFGDEAPGGWWFASRDRRGGVSHVRGSSRKVPSLHRLRREFVSVGIEIGIPSEQIALLVNHRVQTAVGITARYFVYSERHMTDLRIAMERVVAEMEHRMGGQQVRLAAE